MKTEQSTTKLFSVKYKLVIMFICFALIPLFIVSLLYTHTAKKALSTTSSQLSLELVKQSAHNLSTFTNGIENDMTELAASNLTVDSLISDYFSKDIRKRSIAIDSINKQLVRFKATNTNVDGAYVFSQDVAFPIGSISYLFKDELATLTEDLTDNNSVYWCSSTNMPNDHRLAIKKFRDFKTAKDYNLIVSVDLHSIMTYINDMVLLDNSTIYLVDEHNEVIYSPDETITALDENIIASLKDEAAFDTFNLQKQLISYAKLDNGWRIIMVAPEKSLIVHLSSAFITIGLIVVLATILAISLGYFFAQGIAKPIIHLMGLMRQAENGDLTVVALEKGNDETTQLCKSFNHMITNMSTLITETQDVISKTLETSKVLSHSTEQSVNTISELTTSISDIAQGTSQQALNAQQSNMEMTSLADSMQIVSQKVMHLLQSIEGAKQIMETATSTMELLTSTMSSSTQMSADIRASIIELYTLNQNIDAIMTLVDNISEETNLLALNASIEAAHVGEAGKGFAVVANEVRNLADQSKNSTINVRNTLSTIEEKMTQTTSLVERSSIVISEQEQAVTDTSKLIFTIIDILQQMTNELADISGSIDEMQTLKVHMVSQIESIATITEESAASTEEVSSLTTTQQEVFDNLSALSFALKTNMENLDHTIHTFKVNA